jgi:ribosomal protein S18 acetylase RimI-like enzyme
LVRLRGVMLSAMTGKPAPGPWQERARQTLWERLADPDGPLAGYVVANPDRPDALAACVVGVVESRLSSPTNLTGEVGYVFNVATDPEHRRRGYARICMQALVGWFRERGVASVDLRATAEAEPLYRALGFVRSGAPTMRLTLVSQ